MVVPSRWGQGGRSPRRGDMSSPKAQALSVGTLFGSLSLLSPDAFVRPASPLGLLSRPRGALGGAVTAKKLPKCVKTDAKSGPKSTIFVKK